MYFSELGLSNKLLKAIQRSGYEEATPIQEQTIPMVLAGKDVIGPGPNWDWEDGSVWPANH